MVVDSTGLKIFGEGEIAQVSTDGAYDSHDAILPGINGWKNDSGYQRHSIAEQIR